MENIMENIEKQLHQIKANNNDALINHVLDLMKEGSQTKFSHNSKTKLSNVDITFGNDVYEAHENAGKSLTLTHEKAGRMTEYEKFVDGKLRERIVQAGTKSFDYKFGSTTGKLESEIIKDGDYTEHIAFNGQTGKKVYSAAVWLSNGERVYESFDPKKGSITTETVVEPNFEWGTTSRGRISFRQFDGLSGCNTEELIFGDGKHYLNTNNWHSKSSSHREWNDQPRVIE